MNSPSQPPDQQCIQDVRRFSRFYTAHLGTLDEHLLKSSLSLAEARVLYEIATSPDGAASSLAERLRLDPGYLSRMLARFEERGLIRRRRSSADARQAIISLTAAGRKEFGTLDRRSSEQVAAMLAPLSVEERRRLTESMAVVETILDPAPAVNRAPFILRGHRPGDMGEVVSRHGALYAQEYGWDERFEAMVARITADFIDQYDPACERCWIAERDGQFLGCVFLVKDRSKKPVEDSSGHAADRMAPSRAEKTARLRLLLVEPSARGLGLGRALVRQCTEFARQVGYERIVLWTNSVLDAARHLYECEGYRLLGEEHHDSFGKKLTSQDWELML